MSYAIVYNSVPAIPNCLPAPFRKHSPQRDCLYFGRPDPKALEAEVIYLGFWTDKGRCDEESAAFLQGLTAQRVFLFGTAGFGGSSSYFDQILDRVRGELPPQAEVIGTFMCQGKMPMSVRERYEAMPESPRRTAMLENFDEALHRPDGQDLAEAKAAVLRAQ